MSKERLGDGANLARWDLPSVGGSGARRFRHGPTVTRLENIERDAYDQGFESGREEGLKAIQAEMARRVAELDVKIAALDAVFGALAKPLEQLDAEVETELVQLALAIGKQLVRRELKIDPTQVIGIVRHTVGLLPVAARDIRVHLHPDDAAIVNAKLATPTGEREWTVVEDPLLARGGCRVTTNTSSIDGRLESRLAAATAALLGDDRMSGARSSDEPDGDVSQLEPTGDAVSNRDGDDDSAGGAD
jgi:flagellar assembly protein FliH